MLWKCGSISVGRENVEWVWIIAIFEWLKMLQTIRSVDPSVGKYQYKSSTLPPSQWYSLVIAENWACLVRPFFIINRSWWWMWLCDRSVKKIIKLCLRTIDSHWIIDYTQFDYYWEIHGPYFYGINKYYLKFMTKGLWI